MTGSRWRARGRARGSRRRRRALLLEVRFVGLWGCWGTWLFLFLVDNFVGDKWDWCLLRSCRLFAVPFLCVCVVESGPGSIMKVRLVVCSVLYAHPARLSCLNLTSVADVVFIACVLIFRRLSRPSHQGVNLGIEGSPATGDKMKVGGLRCVSVLFPSLASALESPDSPYFLTLLFVCCFSLDVSESHPAADGFPSRPSTLMERRDACRSSRRTQISKWQLACCRASGRDPTRTPCLVQAPRCIKIRFYIMLLLRLFGAAS